MNSKKRSTIHFPNHLVQSLTPKEFNNLKTIKVLFSFHKKIPEDYGSNQISVASIIINKKKYFEKKYILTQENYETGITQTLESKSMIAQDKKYY